MSYLPSLALARRELIGTLRNPKVFLGLVLFMIITIVAVGIQWPADSVALADMQFYADKFFTGLKFALLTGCILVVPGVAGAAISLEHEQESFDFLYLTLIRPAGLLAAKLVAVVAVFILLFAAILPVFGCVVFLVGVDWVEMGSAALMLVLYTVTCAAWGLLFSALFKRTLHALLASYLSLLITLGVPLALAAAFVEAVGHYELSSPLRELQMVVAPVGVLFQSGLKPTWIITALVFQVFLAGFALLIAFIRIRRPPAPRPAKAEKPIDDACVLELRRRRFPFYLFDPRARKPLIRDGVNPVMAKELRFGALGRAVNLMRLAYLSFFAFSAVAGIVAVAGIWDNDSPRERFEQLVLGHLLQMVPVIILAVALAVPAITRESELGNLDALRLTPLSPGRIIRGKCLAGAALLFPLVIAMTAANVPFFYLHEPDAKFLMAMATIYIAFIVCLLVAYSFGLLGSVLARKTNSAVMAGYALAATVLIGLFVGLMLLSDLKITPRWDEHDLALFSPITIFIENLDRNCEAWDPREQWRPFSLYFCVGMAAYAVLGGAVILATARLFGRLRMRER